MHIKPITWFVAAMMFLFATTESVTAAEKAKNDNVVKDGMLVSMEYTLKGTDGKVIDSSKGREPLKYVHGQKSMIPGLRDRAYRDGSRQRKDRHRQAGRRPTARETPTRFRKFLKKKFRQML